ncbi:MAG: hypothetical protein AAGC82_10805 [Pseudomonadota bacterium]
MIRSLWLILCVCAAANAAMAQSILGSEISVQVVTYDDPDAPILESQVYSAQIAPGAEFGLGPEGHPFVDIVQVTIDIGNDGVVFSYESVPGIGGFTQAKFNGYILTISPCAAISAPELVTAQSISLAPSALRSDENQLFVNVAGLAYQPETRIEIAFDVQPCPVS